MEIKTIKINLKNALNGHFIFEDPAHKRTFKEQISNASLNTLYLPHKIQGPQTQACLSFEFYHAFFSTVATFNEQQ